VCVYTHTLTHIAPSHDYNGEGRGGRGREGGREGGEEGGVPRAKKKSKPSLNCVTKKKNGSFS
jgi:hypothetical protein